MAWLTRSRGKVRQEARQEVGPWLADQSEPWVDWPCPLCGNSSDEVLSQVERFGFPLRLVRCRECSLLRANPRLRTELLPELFSRWYRRLYFGTRSLDEPHWQRERAGGQAALSFIFAHRKPPSQASWLDYGCGSGGFVALLCDRGYRARGFDIDTGALDFGLARGAAVGDAGSEKELHVVSFLRVLHYLPDLKETLAQVTSRLQPGGLVYVDLPGVRSWLRGPSCRARFDQMASLFHLTYFDLHHLEVLMSHHHLRLVCGTEQIRALFELVPGSPPLAVDPRPLRAFLADTQRYRQVWWLLSFLPGQLRKLLDREYAASAALRSAGGLADQDLAPGVR